MDDLRAREVTGWASEGNLEVFKRIFCFEFFLSFKLCAQPLTYCGVIASSSDHVEEFFVWFFPPLVPRSIISTSKIPYLDSAHSASDNRLLNCFCCTAFGAGQFNLRWKFSFAGFHLTSSQQHTYNISKFQVIVKFVPSSSRERKRESSENNTIWSHD